MNTATIWRTALERLEHIQIDSESKSWLREAHLSSSPHVNTDDIDAPLDEEESGLYFMLSVSNG
ncbi:MAG: hypothetical protein M3Y39_14625, partial [Chloroflexota bacterium]|nr:hypothetical protein [Chloroflexota bacterium]